MNIAVVGCGLIGEKRVKALGEHKLLIAADNCFERAQRLSSIGGGEATDDWKEAVSHPDVDIVIVATTNDWLTPVGHYALMCGKHVLVEKPAARSGLEIEPFYQEAKQARHKVKVGFNLRYHPAMLKAKSIIASNEIGELMFMRGRYGHGGRRGYDREWRANKNISGGGELIDQGVHLIDLSRWFLGDFSKIDGFSTTYFWDMPVDDNAFISLRTPSDQAAWLQVSCTEWKNMFSLEIYGKHGKLQIEGLGGSYGVERLSYYKMLPEMGPPETTIWEYPGDDKSWKNEFDAFISAIANDGDVCGDLHDAYETLKIVDVIYGR